MVLAVSSVAETEARLRDWPKKEARRRQLEQRIQQTEERIKRMRDALSADGILGRIVQQYEHMALGLPRSEGSIHDKEAEHTVRTLDAIRDAELRLDAFYAEYHEVSRWLEDLEDAVSSLHVRYQVLLTAYFRDGRSCQDICDELYISKSRFYQMLDEAIRALSI